MMTTSAGRSKVPRSVVVLDVGATNVDVVQFSSEFQIIDKCSTTSLRIPAPPYLSLDAESVINFALQSIQTFDQNVPVDAIVPCTHGSAVALLDGKGELALPVMSYLSPVPDHVAVAYKEFEPPFSEVFAPTNPGALTVARQLFWQEHEFPADFARVRTIMPYPQYIAFRLCGERSSDISSLGAQTHLWAPRDRSFSSLARNRGWSTLIEPLRSAGDALGPLRGIDLKGEGIVFCGIHDSSASFLQVAQLEPAVLLSTGTWIIGFDTEAELTSLDPLRDQVANVRPDGRPIASARFMGGEEFSMIAKVSGDAQPSLAAVQDLIDGGTMALPSFTDSGGPIPGTGGRGVIIGPQPETEEGLVSLATLYVALMTTQLLEGLGSTKLVLVDGVFAESKTFMALLARLLPDREVFSIQRTAGSAHGAASLVLQDRAPRLKLKEIAAATLRGLDDYREVWVEKAKKSQKNGVRQ
ncbi:FGGY-family carbohydrate kinase [Ruegeria arenilitoris]|uniref:FGGY-family carbohydrate kinase n=1 Tax=Ruegeria arenilitoris TaxID=1173585 RepID=UPI00147CC060|nr:hypothetical protein [Ruegeria arenilitoris]